MYTTSRLFGIAFGLACCTFTFAQDPAEPPLKRIVLHSAGVGYFEHEAPIQGAATVELRVAVDDLNDLLKSVLVQDPGGKGVRAIDLPSPRLADAKRRHAFELDSEPTLAELLHQLRGEQVELADLRISGTILGVELKEGVEGGRAVQSEFLNLLTREGLRSIALDSSQAIRLTNESLNQQLVEALREAHAEREVTQRVVRFDFVAADARTVRIGYLRATPVWKTSYRLVLAPDQPAMLQGWAIVENTGNRDWRQVSLALAHGRPVTFAMDLHRPLMAARPEFSPEALPPLTSRLYGARLGDLDFDRPIPNAQAIPEHDPIGGLAGGGLGQGGGGGFGGGFGGGLGGGGGGAGAGVGGDEVTGMSRGNRNGSGPLKIQMTTPVDGVEVGEQFHYQIQTPVDLPAQLTALIPFLHAEVKAERFSVFTAGADSAHPMLALRLTNTTADRLVGGSVAVFDEGGYAGDAQLGYLAPGDQRLVNYAQDSSLRVASQITPRGKRLSGGRLTEGVFTSEYLVTRRHTYRIANRGVDARVLLLEHPRPMSPWSLAPGAKPVETTDRHARFELPVPAEKTVELVIDEESTEAERFPLKTVELAKLETLRKLELAADMRAAIEEIRTIRMQVQDEELALGDLGARLTTIVSEQGRVRANMSALDRDTELYGNYLRKLTEQEQEVDRLQQQIGQHRTRLSEQQHRLSRFFPDSADPFK